MVSDRFIVLLTEEPDTIFERMKCRDGIAAFDPSFISKLQEAERQRAEGFQQENQVPYYEHPTSSSFSAVERYIKTLVKK